MSYTREDIEDAVRKISAACPAAVFIYDDYGLGLSVGPPTREFGLIVFQPPRDAIGKSEIVGNVDTIIARLKGEAS